MKLLAMDTSTQVMSVAILDMEHQLLLGEITTNVAQNHSASLMPTITYLLQLVKSSLNEVEAIVVACGPGSYTGLRIGVTTAKTLAWARGLPLYSVSSLATLAMNGLRWGGLIVPLFDARRQRVYSGIYQAEEGHLLEIEEDRVVHMDEWLEEIKALEQPALFLGEAHSFQEQIQRELEDRAFFGTLTEHVPRAAQLAMIGWRKWANQMPAEDAVFTPNYCQVTEAEAKYLLKDEDKLL